MIKHTLEIAERSARLRLKNQQLLIQLAEGEHSFACEDIGVLVLQNPATSISVAVLDSLTKAGAAIVICGRNRLPSALMLPLPTHTQLVPRMMAQLQASRPALKQAWKQIVQAKIHAQAKQLENPWAGKLNHLAEKVRSGDPENCEAQAAKLYWANRFSEQYADGDQRDPDGQSAFNICLNYGYAIVRAAVARAIVSAGLIPALGAFHKQRSNPYCLADDLMEPLRPLVDNTIHTLLTDKLTSNETPLDTSTRKAFLALLAHSTNYGSKNGPLMTILPRYINSYYRMITGENNRITFPTF